LVPVKERDLDSHIEEAFQSHRRSSRFEQFAVVTQPAAGHDIRDLLHFGPPQGGFLADNGYLSGLDFRTLTEEF
jgi:hypothetical protein